MHHFLVMLQQSMLMAGPQGLAKTELFIRQFALVVAINPSLLFQQMFTPQ